VSGLRPAELSKGLPDFIGAGQRRIVARVTLGNQHFAATLHDKLPSPVTLSENAGGMASGRVAETPHSYR
jgi:hypothetical protein